MAYRGRRYKTDRYIQFKNDCHKLLRPLTIPEGDLELTIEIGVSTARFDLDNCLKPFIDILQVKYDFNDNRIYKICAYKEIVKKGCEYIDFEIKEIEY